ncbi:MAG: NAD(P)-binding domain-containing protein [Opitutales bacterium]|nr:NAD(P)-binding domain-containing protein [Opitutales bacterium]
MIYDCCIVGAGPSGLGIGLGLKEAGLANFLVLEQYGVGQTFRQWPKEMRFITPSFNSNSFMRLSLP